MESGRSFRVQQKIAFIYCNFPIVSYNPLTLLHSTRGILHNRLTPPQQRTCSNHIQTARISPRLHVKARRAQQHTPHLPVLLQYIPPDMKTQVDFVVDVEQAERRPQRILAEAGNAGLEYISPAYRSGQASAASQVVAPPPSCPQCCTGC